MLTIWLMGYLFTLGLIGKLESHYPWWAALGLLVLWPIYLGDLLGIYLKRKEG